MPTELMIALLQHNSLNFSWLRFKLKNESNKIMAAQKFMPLIFPI